MTIGKRIFAGYLLVLIFASLIAGASLYVFQRTENSLTSFLEVDQRILRGVMQLQLSIHQQSEAFRGYLLYGDPTSLKDWEEGIRRFAENLETMRGMVKADEDRRFLEGLSALERQWEEQQRSIVELVKAGRKDEAIGIAQERMLGLRNQMLNAMPDFVTRREQSYANARMILLDRLDHTKTMLIVLPFITLVLGLGAAGWLTRTITKQLQDAISQIASSTAEISAITSQSASGATETATSVSETTSTVEEVKQTAQVSSQKAKAVSDAARRSAEIAQNGSASVNAMVDGMRGIRMQMESIAQSVVRLSEQGQTIGEIIAAVDDLAEQSNLLAVNAAIEAARAGEQGKGFNVVAQEVKSLAEQSKRATSQVRGILGDIQKATSAAVMATEQGSKAVESGVQQSAAAEQAIRQLAEGLSEAAQAAAQIAASSQQQLVGMDQVAVAMENINKASAQNAAGAKQSEETATALNALATRLRSFIEDTRRATRN